MARVYGLPNVPLSARPFSIGFLLLVGLWPVLAIQTSCGIVEIGHVSAGGSVKQNPRPAPENPDPESPEPDVITKQTLYDGATGVNRTVRYYFPLSDLDADSLDQSSMTLFGERSGFHHLEISFDEQTSEVLIESGSQLVPGESAKLIIDSSLRSIHGEALQQLPRVIRFWIDRGRPEIALESPAPGAILMDGTADITGTCTTGYSVELTGPLEHRVMDCVQGRFSAFHVNFHQTGDVDIQVRQFSDSLTSNVSRRVHVASLPFCSGANLTASPFAGGEGTQENPFRICTLAQLNAIRSSLDSSFELWADIDARPTNPHFPDSFRDNIYGNGDGQVSIDSSDPGFTPIGVGSDESWGSGSHFSGHFDGKGHIIRDLYLNYPQHNYVGLFNCGNGVILRHLELQNVDITGLDRVGAIAGTCGVGSTLSWLKTSGIVRGRSVVGGLFGIVGDNDAVIEDCFSSTTVVGRASNGDGNLGGVIGYLYGTTMSRCGSTGSVSGGEFDVSVGGLAGGLDRGIIFESWSSGDVSGPGTSQRVGGLVGHAFYFSAIHRSYSIGKVEGGLSVGGLLGELHGGNSSVNDSYSTSQVNGAIRVGSLVGRLHNQWGVGSVNRSYAMGYVSGSHDVGGLVGFDTSGTTPVQNSYWSFDLSKQQTSVSGIHLSFENFLLGTSFSGFDWNAVWQICDGQSAPWLVWENRSCLTNLSATSVE